MADRVWGSGKVTAQPIERALSSVGLGPDFEVVGVTNPPVMVLHRHLADGEVYFLSNRKGRPFSGDVAFRVTGREAESWDADTGSRHPLSYRIDGSRTIVPVSLEANGSALIVFRKKTASTQRMIDAPTETRLAAIDGPWTVTFQADRGAPATHDISGPGSWTESKLAGVKYFSGTASYKTTWSWTPSGAGRVILDLGEFHELADVLVNGRVVKTVWKPPSRVDVTSEMKPGANAVEIRVTNLWVNRLIGDVQPGAEKVTFTVSAPYDANAPLRPSGLIGPVRVLRQH